MKWEKYWNNGFWACYSVSYSGYQLPKSLGTKQLNAELTVTLAMPWYSEDSSTRPLNTTGEEFSLTSSGWMLKWTWVNSDACTNPIKAEGFAFICLISCSLLILKIPPPSPIALFPLSEKLCSCLGSWGTRWWRLRLAIVWETPTHYCNSMRGL